MTHAAHLGLLRRAVMHQEGGAWSKCICRYWQGAVAINRMLDDSSVVWPLSINQQAHASPPGKPFGIIIRQTMP